MPPRYPDLKSQSVAADRAQLKREIRAVAATLPRHIELAICAYIADVGYGQVKLLMQIRSDVLNVATLTAGRHRQPEDIAMNAQIPFRTPAGRPLPRQSSFGVASQAPAQDPAPVAFPKATNIARLDLVLQLLNERDRAFATSLLASAFNRRLSDKQAHWIGVLADRGEEIRDAKAAAGPAGAAPAAAPARPRDADVELGRIVEMFDLAAASLKWPKIRAEANGTTVTLSRAGESSNAPGAINIKSGDTYLGRIHTDGRLVLSVDGRAQPGLKDALQAIAADPEATAKAYGLRFGHCCFCGRELTAEESVGRGFGPICAERFGL